MDKYVENILMFTRWLHLISPCLCPVFARSSQTEFSPSMYPRFTPTDLTLYFKNRVQKQMKLVVLLNVISSMEIENVSAFMAIHMTSQQKPAWTITNVLLKDCFNFLTYFPPFLTPSNLKWIKSCDFGQTEACKL